MAVTQTEARPRPPAPKNTRVNEIVAIGLFALGILVALCLVSYNPNDPSWNAAGQNGTRNLIGAVGANVSAGLLQAVGIASPLLPLLLLAAAWRRFRTRRIHAPLLRLTGLAVLVLAAAALFALFIPHALFDASVPPGGFAGAILARSLAAALNTVGAAVLLGAAGAVGLLLATNFSFVRSSEKLLELSQDRFKFLNAIPVRFSLWRSRLRERARVQKEKRAAARAERTAAREAEKSSTAKSAAERVAEFMRENSVLSNSALLPSDGVNRETTPAEKPRVQRGFQDLNQEISRSEIPFQRGLRKSGEEIQDPENTFVPKRARAASVGGALGLTTDENAKIDEMVKTASVVRTDGEDPRVASSVVLAESARRSSGASVLTRRANYRMPFLEFLNPPPPHSEQADEELLGLAAKLAEKCKEFNVTGQIKHICPGPVVTTYEFKPDPGVKYSRVTGLVDDLCLALKAESIRIDRMPGKPHVGIEVPNPHRETIYLREVIESRQFSESVSKLTIALGKTIDGLNYVADLAKMPHLLIAGTTGAGKSVGVNSLIVSILYKARPDEVKFIMVDPKRLELGLYADIPHLATPIITDPKRAAISLKWAVGEMERRYRDLAGWGVRNIDGYNGEIERRNAVKDFDEAGEPWKPLPYIVIIIDELADLMMVSGHEVEESITRLAQMARAVGIHLVLATQRPSVDVITGLIKANFPSRISYRVSSKVDSRTIIDANGAEQLLGRGDMLFLPPGTSRLVRVHGAYVDESEIGRIVTHVKAQAAPAYDESITQSEEEALGINGGTGERDELFEDALRICVEMKRASTSVLQRRLRIGYGRAAAILDTMEREGFIGQVDGARPRPVLGRSFELVADWDEAGAGA